MKEIKLISLNERGINIMMQTNRKKITRKVIFDREKKNHCLMIKTAFTVK